MNEPFITWPNQIRGRRDNVWTEGMNSTQISNAHHLQLKRQFRWMTDGNIKPGQYVLPLLFYRKLILLHCIKAGLDEKEKPFFITTCQCSQHRHTLSALLPSRWKHKQTNIAKGQPSFTLQYIMIPRCLLLSSTYTHPNLQGVIVFLQLKKTCTETTQTNITQESTASVPIIVPSSVF